MSVNQITIAGNVTADPTVRHTASGRAVANFTVADTPRHQGSDGQWTDGETLFQRVSIWGVAAENVAASIRRGDRVVVTGKLTQKPGYESEGEQRPGYAEIVADEVAASLKFARAAITKAASNDN